MILVCKQCLYFPITLVKLILVYDTGRALTLWVCCPCSLNPEPHSPACCVLSRCSWPRLVRCSLFLFSYRQGTASAAGIFEASWKQVHIALFRHTLFENQCNCNTELTESVSGAFSLVLSVSLWICDNQRSWLSGFGFKHTHTHSVTTEQKRVLMCQMQTHIDWYKYFERGPGG